MIMTSPYFPAAIEQNIGSFMADAASDRPMSQRSRRSRSKPVVPTAGWLKPENKFAALFFYAIVALAPLPFGSHDPTTVAFWELCLAVCLIFCRPGNLGGARTAILFGIILLLAAYGSVLHEQMSAASWFASPEPLWAETSKLLGGRIVPIAAAVQNAPFYNLGPVFADALALSLGLVIGADRARARQILAVFAWSGAAYAIYGIGSAVLEPSLILWREREAYIGNVLGTFINRNTAATYFGCCGVVWLLILCEVIKKRLPDGRFTWKNFSRKILSEARFDTIIAFLGLFVCVMALLMTNSRAGVIISLAGMIGACSIRFRDDLPQKSGRLFAIVGAMCCALLVLQFLGGSVSQRFDASGLSDEGRLDTYKGTLRMIVDHPWLGTGLGSFVWAFPSYRSPPLWGIWDMAHSTPLELLAELGIPLALLIWLGWSLILGVLIRGIRVRRRDTMVPLAALSVASIALLHSCVDFPLQISGFAIVAMAVIGAGLAQSFSSAPE
jgi:O-antigen ligase